MHNAKLSTSKRLQRVLSALQKGPRTTRQLIEEAHVCAVNSIIAELRANGYTIACKPLRKGVFLYELEVAKQLEMDYAL